MVLVEDLKKTIQYHDKLNPDIWKPDGKIRPDVWITLNKIANEFIKYLEIPKSSVLDVIFLGGNAGYNYTQYSDIDLHLVLDPGKFKNGRKYIDNYLFNAKELWNKNHDIFVYGHEVEVYAELPAQSRKTGQGVYSIKQNKWLQEPDRTRPSFDEDYIQDKVTRLSKEIDHLTDGVNDSIESLKRMKDKLKRMRVSALEKGGEFAPDNIVFKELRNTGKIQQIFDRINELFDDELSL